MTKINDHHHDYHDRHHDIDDDDHHQNYNYQVSGQAIGKVFRQNLLTIATMGGVVAGFNLLTFGAGISAAGGFFQVLKELFTGLWC